MKQIVLMTVTLCGLASGLFAGAPPCFDVAVVGAGPGGIGAALAAAKTGAKTVVLERYGYVGGGGQPSRPR